MVVNKKQSSAPAKKREQIHSGRVYVIATFNNTKIYVTDQEGNLKTMSSAGALGHKGSRKSTPFAAQQAAKEAAEKAIRLYGMQSVDIFINGPGPGRDAAGKAAGACFQRVNSVSDITGIPHNGTREKGERRV